MTASLDLRCRNLLVALTLIDADDTVHVTPLTGGVASDIAKVTTGERTLCVKFALPKLKVAADWFAPVHRNRAEYAWLQVAAAVAPSSAVTLFGQSQELHGFAMEYLCGSDVYLWKTALLSEAVGRGEAAAVGDLLGRVHAASARPDFDTRAFDNRDDFHALRIEPYLLHTASKHPPLAATLQEMADQLYHASTVLVHGDVSPKNILFRPSGPVLLDAECATMGDASFDVAFCLNHVLLKAIHLPGTREHNLKAAQAFWQAYQVHVLWEAQQDLEARLCRLLPALMLARVDGKSPVEYLSMDEQMIVQGMATKFLASPVDHLSTLLQGVAEQLQE